VLLIKGRNLHHPLLARKKWLEPIDRINRVRQHVFGIHCRNDCDLNFAATNGRRGAQQNVFAAVMLLTLLADSRSRQIVGRSTIEGTGGAPIPDCSGTLSHRHLTSFESPSSGPGPVLNRSCRSDGVANFQRPAGDYTNLRSGIRHRHVFWDLLVQVFQQQDRITMIYRHGNAEKTFPRRTSSPAPSPRFSKRSIVTAARASRR
jgi:hypothetical protein